MRSIDDGLLAEGTRVGEYVIEARLHGTELACVFLARHLVLPRRARIAVVRAEHHADPAANAALMREATVLEVMQHAGVPRVFECGVVAGRAWIASEHVEGLQISDAIAIDPLSVTQALRLLRDAADILEHAHARGAVHRAVSELTLLRCPPERGVALCITGWSEARVDPSERERSQDVFALGAVIYKVLTLSQPGVSLSRPGVPAALATLVDRMLDADPTVRPTCSEVRTEALRLLELFELPAIDESADLEVEQVSVRLVDISHGPPATTRSRTGRWMADAQPVGSVKPRRP